MAPLDRCKTPEEMKAMILEVLRQEDKYVHYQGFVHSFPNMPNAKRRMAHEQCLQLEKEGLIRRRNESSDHVTWELNPSGDDGMFERFTDRARKVMQRANYEANCGGYEGVQPLHLLVATLAETGGIAHHLCQLMNADRESLMQKARESLNHFRPKISDEELNRRRLTNARLPIMPDLRSIIQESVNMANSLGHHYVGTEHLLIGMAHHDWFHGVLNRILSAANMKPNRLIEEVLSLLHGACDNQPGRNGPDAPVPQAILNALREIKSQPMQFISPSSLAQNEAKSFDTALEARIFQAERAINEKQNEMKRMDAEHDRIEKARIKLDADLSRLRDYHAALLRVKAGDESTDAPGEASLAA